MRSGLAVTSVPRDPIPRVKAPHLVPCSLSSSHSVRGGRPGKVQESGLESLNCNSGED